MGIEVLACRKGALQLTPATQSIVSAMSAGAVVLLKKKLGLNTEKHWLDTLETNVATASTASVMANPMVIPQGDTVNTRNGNTVRMTSLVLKGRIQGKHSRDRRLPGACISGQVQLHPRYNGGSRECS